MSANLATYLFKLIARPPSWAPSPGRRSITATSLQGCNIFSAEFSYPNGSIHHAYLSSRGLLFRTRRKFGGERLINTLVIFGEGQSHLDLGNGSVILFFSVSPDERCFRPYSVLAIYGHDSIALPNKANLSGAQSWRTCTPRYGSLRRKASPRFTTADIRRCIRLEYSLIRIYNRGRERDWQCMKYSHTSEPKSLLTLRPFDQNSNLLCCHVFHFRIWKLNREEQVE
jgi:hypothetical protein